MFLDSDKAGLSKIVFCGVMMTSWYNLSFYEITVFAFEHGVRSNNVCIVKKI